MHEVALFIKEWFQAIVSVFIAIAGLIRAWPAIMHTYRTIKEWYLKDVYHRLNKLEQVTGLTEMDEHNSD